MAKIRLTKNELKKQKDSLKRFNRYLPTLQLKKQQLQIEIRKVNLKKAEMQTALDKISNSILAWVDLFCEEVGLADLIKIDTVRTGMGNIAGIDIPLFEGINFEEVDYDLFKTPLWVDSAIEAVEQVVILEVELIVLEKQIQLLGEELRITTQRVNLFEKVKIPEAKENIRRIQIYLGDQQTAAVVRGKIAKNKLVKV